MQMNFPGKSIDLFFGNARHANNVRYPAFAGQLPFIANFF